MKKMMKKPQLDNSERQTIRAIAHRGANLLAPENSLESFKIASKMGYNDFEIDVQMSRDGIVFVCHDDNLERLTGEKVFLSELLASDLEEIKIDGHYAIPKLIDVLNKFPKAKFNIDAKSWAVVSPLCKILNSFSEKSRFCIGGFSDSRITTIVRNVNLHLQSSLGPKSVYLFYLSWLLNIKFRFTGDFIQLPLTCLGFNIISNSVVQHIHSSGLRVHVWTVNDEENINRLIDIGVDGIMTDDCVLLKKILIKRNLW
jgi:glycerophosphoryl diester phosphodiesterase